MQFNLVNNEEQALYLGGVVVYALALRLSGTLRPSVALRLSVTLRLSIVLCLSVVLRCIVSVVFSILLFLQAFSVLLHPSAVCALSSSGC